MAGKSKDTSLLLEIKTELATNTNETKNIGARLDKLNGTVAHHESRLGMNEQAIVIVTKTLEALNDNIKAATKTKSAWIQWLVQGLIVLGLIVLYNILLRTHILAPLTTIQ